MAELQQVRFEKMVYGGECLGRLADGRAVFVPFVLPGETAEIEITENKQRFAHGRAVKLLEVSPDRIAPPCPYFSICGGCHYQHLGYAQQLDQSCRVASLSRHGIAGAHDLRDIVNGRAQKHANPQVVEPQATKHDRIDDHRKSR